MEATLKTQLQKASIDLDDSSINQLETFTRLLLEWNKIHNLTGAKDHHSIYAHIIDSLYPIRFISSPKRLLDVGTGAGFPGLMLAIALKETRVCLCEPRKKRASFLRYASNALSLSNVNVVSKRVESYHDTPFDLITSRAVTDTALLLQLCAHLSNDSTQYLFYKGERVHAELQNTLSQSRYGILSYHKRNYLHIKGKG